MPCVACVRVINESHIERLYHEAGFDLAFLSSIIWTPMWGFIAFGSLRVAELFEGVGTPQV